MTTQATTSTSASSIISAEAALAAEQATQARLPNRVLDQNDFLKLVIAQMANQDPTNPQKDTEFIGQMTQFTTLEQTKNMQSDIAQMRSQQQVLQAMGLLNREVVFNSETTGLATGIVTGLTMDGTTPKLLIGDQAYDLSDIVTIRMADQDAQN